MGKPKQGPYDDIIHLPHPISKKRSQMPRKDRAAQFSPFAAVVGHEAAVRETARLVDEKRDLDEMQKAIIDQNLTDILSKPTLQQEVRVVYFIKDPHKDGGKYAEYIGHILKYDPYERMIIFEGGLAIPIEDVQSLETYE